LGRIDDGRLSLVGRSKDSIIVSGVNYYSHELESALDPLEGIERSFIAASPTRPKGADTEQLVVTMATSFPLNDEARLHKLTVAVRNTAILLWGFRPAVILPLPKDAFPKTSLGKIQRALLRKRSKRVSSLNTRPTLRMSPGGNSVVIPARGRNTARHCGYFAGLFGLDSATVSATRALRLGRTSLDILKLTHTLAGSFNVVDVPVAQSYRVPRARVGGPYRSPATRRETAVRAHRTPAADRHEASIVCVHPGIGEVLVFVNLAKYFVKRARFFAIRARGFDADESYFGSLDEIVSTYVQAVRSRQAHGPYALAGYSLGGPIAVEMARVLESQGEEVAFLGCIDGPPCDMVDALDESTSP